MVTKIRKNNRNKGLATVEAAIVLPIVILLTLGLIEYGWLFLKAHQITNAARQGARVAIRYGATTTQVDTMINGRLAEANLANKNPTITVSNINVGRGETVKVTISVPFANVAILNILLLPKPDNIQSEVTMAKEGQ